MYLLGLGLMTVRAESLRWERENRPKREGLTILLLLQQKYWRGHIFRI
jgi:hypothetical protein